MLSCLSCLLSLVVLFSPSLTLLVLDSLESDFEDFLEDLLLVDLELLVEWCRFLFAFSLSCSVCVTVLSVAAGVVLLPAATDPAGVTFVPDPAADWYPVSPSRLSLRLAKL